MSIEQLQAKVIETLKNNLPAEIIFSVDIRTKVFSKGQFLKISIRTSDKLINGCEGMYPDHISLTLDTLNLEFQIFGCSGGQWLYRKTDKNIPKERYNALGSEKITFRKPKPTEEAVLKALGVICERYVAMLQDFKNRGLLQYENYTNYSFLN